ncbi:MULTISPECIES: FadR/GntR family transcriptional regulator [Prauserella salsuginis group]|uniref:FadR/GntR family transcriptional regulator n=1 Tax=Prauserella salsuginis TaxID=387889 RepID=A0ABW6G100_9PSEU|nr:MULTISPECIES: FCD domain-containing protein [Prauserella salsuginis group]MCR3722026.1 transcriptional regulator, GntR family [Prauserella flava]MCR3736032.1 transcriptional regulator, GntR family [Prauserella salsuginis]
MSKRSGDASVTSGSAAASETSAASAPPRAISGYQAIVDHLRREMTLGRIRPGDRLPPERQLADQLGVARDTLRQALRVLEGSGQITIRRGSHGGAFVQASMMEAWRIRQDIRERADDIVALLEFRAVIDSAAARFAAERRSDEELAAMEQAQAELEASEALHDSRDADTAFHLAVARASGNHELAVAVEDARVKMFAPVDLLGFQFLKESCVEGHALVLAAIRERDPDRAAAEMTRHLAATRDEFELILTEGL